MEVRITTFMEFVAADWAAKVTAVKNAKNIYGNDYDPKVDYWKKLREAVIDFHENGRSAKHLSTLSERVDAKKAANYKSVIDGYSKWLKGHEVEWIGTSSVPWNSGDLTVKVHPELGLRIDGEQWAIKLWLKGQRLTKKRVEATLHLLDLTHGTLNTRVGILDARAGRLITPTRLVPGIDALLAGEAAAFVTMWNAL